MILFWKQGSSRIAFILIILKGFVKMIKNEGYFFVDRYLFVNEEVYVEDWYTILAYKRDCFHLSKQSLFVYWIRITVK